MNLKKHVNTLYNSSMGCLMDNYASNKRFFTCEEYELHKIEIHEIQTARNELIEEFNKNNEQ